MSTKTRAATPPTAPQQSAETLAAQQRHSLDPSSLKHPNAFMAQDGRTYYKYVNDDGTSLITPKPLEEMSLDDIGSMRSLALVDAPSGRMPQNLTVEFKDPQWAGHWFNKKARSGYRVGVARSLGFVYAKVEDLSTYFAGLNDK